MAAIALAAILVVAAARPAGARESGEWGAIRLWFSPGDSVILTLKDSTHVAGAFRALAQMPPEDYRPRYEAWRASDAKGSRMPAFGAEVELEGHGRYSTKGWFWGLSQEGVELQRKSGGPIAPVKFANFRRLVLRGARPVGSGELERWSGRRVVPLRTEVLVETGDGERRIALDDVASTRAPGSAPLSDGLPGFAKRRVHVNAWALEAGVDQFYGLSGGAVYSRSFPAEPGVLGFDVASGNAVFGGVWVNTCDVDLAVMAPIGMYAGMEPHFGVGLASGRGFRYFTGNVGVGLFTLLTPRVGLRLDCGARSVIGRSPAVSDAMLAVHLGLFVRR